MLARYLLSSVKWWYPLETQLNTEYPRLVGNSQSLERHRQSWTCSSVLLQADDPENVSSWWTAEILRSESTSGCQR